MDTILLLDVEEESLEKVLQKLGFKVLVANKERALLDILLNELVDLIYINPTDKTKTNKIETELITFFKLFRDTKDVSVLVSKSKSIDDLLSGLTIFRRIDFIESKSTPGAIAARIATILRLRKGEETNNDGNIRDLNLKLRDYNSRFEKELKEAKSIQVSLLPEKLPVDPKFNLGVKYVPVEEVGGDWYFVEQNKEKILSIIMADVTGHGLPAALMCSMTKLAFFMTKNYQVSEQFGVVNNLLSPQLPEGRFIAAGAINYNPENGAIHLSKAGIPPVLICSPDTNSFRELNINGFAFGFFMDSQYSCIEDTLSINEVLVMLTDGITESVNRDGEMYGVKRLAESVLTQDKNSTAKELVEGVYTNLLEFCDGRIFKDDITLIILKR